MAKFFKDQFAVDGDKTVIPNNIQPSGSVSYSEGFGINYTLDIQTDPNALAFPRGQFNQLMFDITDALQHYQTICIPDFITTADNGGTAYAYANYALALYNNKIYQSKKDNNTSLPTVTADWKLIDNLQNAVIFDGVTFEATVVDGDVVYFDAANTRYAKALADGTDKQNALGIADVTNGRVYTIGYISLFTTLSPGAIYYLSETTPGILTVTLPETNVVKVGTALSATTLALTISVVEKTANYAFKMYLTAVQNVSSGGFVKVAMDTIDFDTGGCVDLANNWFEAKADGYYYMHGVVSYENFPINSAYSYLIKNGSEQIAMSSDMPSAANNQVTLLVATLVYLEKGDTISVDTSNSAATTQPIRTGVQHTFLCGYKLP